MVNINELVAKQIIESIPGLKIIKGTGWIVAMKRPLKKYTPEQLTQYCSLMSM